MSGEKGKKLVVEDPRAERTLLEALRGKARGRTELVKLTRADAVALTGLPSEQAEPALKSLVKSYRSHLAVTDDGELIYEFDPALERRDRVPLGERLRAAGDVTWRGFQLLFKIWIVVTLIAYVVAFIAMMIALMTMRQGDDRDDRRGGGVGWLWFWLMPDWGPGAGYYDDPYSRRRQQPKLPRKRFYQSVFDFVFGPKGAPLDAREADKRLLAFLRDHKGRVTASELVALTGASLQRADEELTRLMVEYDGEVEVAEDGTLVYVFADLLVSAGSVGGSWAWDWERPEPTPPLTGNTSNTDLAIGGFAGFNLLASLTIAPAFLARFHLSGNPWATFFATLFPLLFSLVFFAVPGARWLKRKRQETKRARRQLRRELMRQIWSAPAAEHDPEQLAKTAAERTRQPPPAARAMLDALVAELDGDVANASDGAVRYVFPRLAEEQRAVAKARAEARAVGLGRVVFASDRAGDGSTEGR